MSAGGTGVCRRRRMSCRDSVASLTHSIALERARPRSISANGTKRQIAFGCLTVAFGTKGTWTEPRYRKRSAKRSSRRMSERFEGPGESVVRPSLHHHPRALPKRNLLFRLRRDEGPIRSNLHAMVVEASDVLNDAVASGVPNIDAEGEMRLGLHGQVDSTRP